jgi:iron(III) transport system substrate-binding protein
MKRALLPFITCFALAATLIPLACRRTEPQQQVVVYCSVDEPYASKIFAEFQKQSGIHVVAQYDVESSKSIGLSEKIRAERDKPRADVWWCSEAFLTVRMADDGVLAPYRPPTADDVPAQFKDEQGLWTGIGLRARVLAVGPKSPPFAPRGIGDLADPRLKGQIVLSRPTAGSTGAHVAALYSFWGPDKARAYFQKLRDNGGALVGGNAVVAQEIAGGAFVLGLTDSDDVANTAANSDKIAAILPDQDTFGTLAMPTTIALVKGAPHEGPGKKLIDFLASRQVEQKLIEMKFAGWSVRGGAGAIKAMPLDYHAVARIYAQAQREATAIMEGRSFNQ